MKKRTVAFSKESSNLFFHILTKCNLSCGHCYINPEQHGENTLSIETIRQWLRLFSKKCQNINVIFLGGEPTLHPDLSLAIKEAKALGFKSITIDTNGYLFHNILERVTPDEVDFISFSLDGATKKTNDAIRGEGCYDTVLKGIEKAKQAGFATSMIYTVSGENLHELTLMPELLETLKIDRFFIQVIGIRGNSTAHGNLRVSPDPVQTSDPVHGKPSSLQLTKAQWLETVPDVAKKVAKLGITVTWPKVFLTPDETFECAGLVADNYFIFPNGRIYRCPICEDHPLHSMVITKETIDKNILNNETIDQVAINNETIISTKKINEADLFNLTIPEGCVMNKLIQPGNIEYDAVGHPKYQIACCMLKEEMSQKF